MARVTVEDSLVKAKDHFELTKLTIARVRQLNMGAPSILENDSSDNTDKPVVLALREIASGGIDPSIIESSADVYNEQELRRTVAEQDRQLAPPTNFSK